MENENNELKEAEKIVRLRRHARGMAKAMIESMNKYAEDNNLKVALSHKEAISLIVSSSIIVHQETLRQAVEAGITQFNLKSTEDCDTAEEIMDLEKQFYKEIKDDDDDVHA